MLRRQFVQLIASVGAGSLVPAAAAPAFASQSSHTITFHVKGFSCTTCAVGLDTMLKQQKGVASSHSTYPEGLVGIECAPATIRPSLFGG